MTLILALRLQAMTSSFRLKAIAYSLEKAHSRKLTGSKFLTKIIRSNAKSILINNYLTIRLRVFFRVFGECEKILQMKAYFYPYFGSLG